MNNDNPKALFQIKCKHLEVAALGWQAPACHSELELASEGSSAASAKRSLAALSA